MGAQFAPYVGSFVLSIYFNGKVLQYSNVETLIAFRSCSPLAVSILDWAFLGRELPSLRSVTALLGVVCGAIGYVLCDSEFKMHGVSAYGWVSVYLVVIIFEMTYAKHMITNVKFDSPIWGTVLYNNALAVGPMLLLAVGSGERGRAPRLQRAWNLHELVGLELQEPDFCGGLHASRGGLQIDQRVAQRLDLGQACQPCRHHLAHRLRPLEHILQAGSVEEVTLMSSGGPRSG